MKFSIITPSFRNSEWLKLCIASVADQEGVTLEHIVQDSCSDDGTQDWLPKDPRVKAYVEKDTGMYDAINRGLRRASGDILAYLNCDEQYLPGALKVVASVFEERPDVDIVLADAVVVDTEGRYICCRKSLVPWRMLEWTFLPTLTCSVFFHRRVLDTFNLYYDTRWRVVSDVMWMRDAIHYQLKMAVLRRHTSVFTETGDNLALAAKSIQEKRRAARIMPAWARRLNWPLLQVHRVRCLLHGLYWGKPFTYSLYTKANSSQRSDVFVPKSTIIWWQRHKDARLLAPISSPNQSSETKVG